MTDVSRERRFTITIGAIFVAIAVLSGVDIHADIMEGTSPLHVIVEGCVFAFGSLGAVIMARGFVAASRRARSFQRAAGDLERRLQASERDAERWKQEAGDLLRGLGVAIDSQFRRWSLTEAECEVALLMLKGLSHREIAQIRDVADSTIRQQAQSLYGKAGVSGRNELSAFFLEDLLLPPASS